MEKQLTVAELIEILKALPQDALVEVEGCDCHGDCKGASTLPDGRGVLIERHA